MRGKIINCIDHGSIVQVLLETEQGIRSIVMEHRCFWNIIEVEKNIIGKEIAYDEEDETLSFSEDIPR